VLSLFFHQVWYQFHKTILILEETSLKEEYFVEKTTKSSKIERK